MVTVPATLDLVQWDPAQYRRFANERDRAFLDLTSRIDPDAPRHVVDVGVATYLDLLQGEDPVVEWLRGAALRPLLAELSPHDAQEFSAQLAAKLRDAYPPGPHGTVFTVPRVFAVGHKP